MAFAKGKAYPILNSMAKKLPEARKLLDNLPNMSQDDFEREFGILLRQHPSYDKKTDFNSAVDGIEPIDDDVSKSQPKAPIKESSNVKDLIKKNYKRGLMDTRVAIYKDDVSIKSDYKTAPSYIEWSKETFNDDELDEAYEMITDPKLVYKFNKKPVVMEFDDYFNEHSINDGDYTSHFTVVLPEKATKHSKYIINHELGHALQHTINRVLGRDVQAPNSIGNYGLAYYDLYNTNRKKWAERVNEPELIKLFESAKQENKIEIKEITQKLRKIQKQELEIVKLSNDYLREEWREVFDKTRPFEKIVWEAFDEAQKKMDNEVPNLEDREKDHIQLEKERLQRKYNYAYEIMNKKSPGLGDLEKRKDEMYKIKRDYEKKLYKEKFNVDYKNDLDEQIQLLKNDLVNAKVGHVGSRFVDFMSALHMGDINGKYRLNSTLPHSPSYYGYNRDYANNMSSAEMFANYIEIRTNPDKKYLNYLKQYLPNLVKELDDTISIGLEAMKKGVA